MEHGVDEAQTNVAFSTGEALYMAGKKLPLPRSRGEVLELAKQCFTLVEVADSRTTLLRDNVISIGGATEKNSKRKTADYAGVASQYCLTVVCT